MAEEGDAGDSGSDTGDSDSGAGDPPADNGDGDGDGGSPPESAWPTDWQTRLSKGDEKLQERAGRYSSPEAVFDALVSAQNKLRSGEYIQKLPDGATDEQMAEWRESVGVPKSAEGYTFEGLEIDDSDRDTLGELTKKFHEANINADQARAVVSWIYANNEKEDKMLQEDDEREEREAVDKLNVEWGPKFRVNQNKISNMLTMFPESVREDFMQARLPNGTRLMNNVDMMRGLAQLALTLDPSSTITPVDGDPMQGITDEIAEIEKFMREKRTEYNKDESKQARLRELYGIRDKYAKAS